MNPLSPETLQLRDIHLPGVPHLWPPAPGWWILSAVFIALLIVFGCFVWHRVRTHYQRKQILGLLEQLQQSSSRTDPSEFVAQLSRLLRRVALRRFPRVKIASLTGLDWLHFLDKSGGDGEFSNGPGRVLANGPYVSDLSAAIDTDALTKLAHGWIRKNTGV